MIKNIVSVYYVFDHHFHFFKSSFKVKIWIFMQVVHLLCLSHWWNIIYDLVTFINISKRIPLIDWFSCHYFVSISDKTWMMMLNNQLVLLHTLWWNVMMMMLVRIRRVSKHIHIEWDLWLFAHCMIMVVMMLLVYFISMSCVGRVEHWIIITINDTFSFKNFLHFIIVEEV